MIKILFHSNLGGLTLEKVIDLYELMQTKPEELAKIQYEKLKEHTINRLRKIINLIENDAFDEVRNKLTFSPAGDGMGSDHWFIDFDYGSTEMDLMEVINVLENLKSKSKCCKE
jgi:hypothetical protein